MKRFDGPVPAIVEPLLGYFRTWLTLCGAHDGSNG